MANNFDEFPLKDPIIKDGTQSLSAIWMDSIATFYQNLVSYLTQYGIVPPTLTSEQRDSIQTPQNGQTIYNSTVGSNQYYKNGTWVSYP